MAAHEVLTPVPGTFYRRPDPDSDPFKDEGDAVEVGETIGLVEIMKNFQPVEVEIGGTLSKFLVETDDTVAAGQAVAVVDDGE
ncbi:MAG TPA: acetyl-CoA carboxylase [Solirubrobacteraceae bacterium]|nr:acetyl-CoA carboxylase [Solirubrobacteraceae bacterium]